MSAGCCVGGEDREVKPRSGTFHKDHPWGHLAPWHHHPGLQVMLPHPA